MHVPDDRYEPISVDEAASRLKVSPSTVRRMIRDGKLQAERETRPQGEIVRVLWPAPNDVPPTSHPPSEPPATTEPSAAIMGLLEDLREMRQQQRDDGTQIADLRERIGRAEALVESLQGARDRMAAEANLQMEARLRAETQAENLAAEVMRLQARRWWRWW